CHRAIEAITFTHVSLRLIHVTLVVRVCTFPHVFTDYVGVISVESALYGRADFVTCSGGRPPQELSNTNCSLPTALDVIKARCNGKKVCELSAQIFTFVPDPCEGTFKYLQTKHTCLPASQSLIYRVTCEHSMAHLRCGLVISIHSADFGRRDQSTCSFGRPDSELRNTECFHHVSLIAKRCNGKNSCSMRVSSLVFGDPCYGTYKYLEVTYFCQCK
uniref:SUEL-type lectin domain-containing protein n=1 Tax=Salarias fasciatus TaxID=181472 RepID=A0A672H2J3_SALFA